MTTIEIHACGPETLIQDHGRVGFAGVGVGVSGAADRTSFDLANRMVGNTIGAAGIECLLGGLVLSTDTTIAVAAAGADAPLTINGIPQGHGSIIWLRSGQILRLGIPTRGLRTYLAFRGGIAVPQVLQSRSTDILARLGPDPLSAGDRVPIGRDLTTLPPIDLAPVLPIESGVVRLTALRGPRDSRFTNSELLEAGSWRASVHSNRVGLRIDRPAGFESSFERAHDSELPREPIAPGAIQVPPSGQPVIFLADHPVTGGYPVVAVLRDRDTSRAAQIRPGQGIRFRLV